MCYNYSSDIVVSDTSSKTSSSSSSSLVCSLLASTILVSLLVFSIGFILSYGSKKWTEFILGLLYTSVAFGGSEIYVSTFLLKSLCLDPLLWFF